MKDERIPRAPSKKPCRFFHMNDCFRGDKCHMVHAPKEEMDPCQTHQFWLEDPWTRAPCQWKERCSRLHATYTGPGDPELLRTNIALQTENSQLKRVRAYAAEVLGAGGQAADMGIARSGTSRYNQKLVLLEAKDPLEFSRRCVADPSLCRSILRVYILGGGVCTSLEDVGKAVSAQVARGLHPNSSTETVDGGATVTSPLRVRLQALPKVMERQLTDEKSLFWDDNFPGLIRERQAGVFSHVLSVVFVRGAYLYGLAEAATHGRCIIENNHEDTPICRAFYKIKEVTSRASITYSDQWTAIDIGASPGGWTSFLSTRCRRVLSVDPAELDPAVSALPNVVHVQQMIQVARVVLLALLAEPPQTDGGGNNSDCLATVDDTVLDAGAGIAGSSEEPGIVKQPTGTPGVLPLGRTERCSEGVPSIGETTTTTPCSSATPALSATVVSTDTTAADLIVSDMNAEPEVVTDVLLSSMAAGLAKPGALVIVTFKDFCGRKKRMRDEVATALVRLDAGTGGDNAWVRRKGSIEMGGDTGDSGACVPDGGGGLGWRIDGIETMKLLAGGQAEVTIVGHAARAAICATKLPTLS